jgi:hypothetical protein
MLAARCTDSFTTNTFEEVVPLFGKAKSWLRSFLLSHRRRVLVFSGVSAFGSALLYLGVKKLNIDASVVNAVLSPPMFFVGFFVIRKYGFPDRGISAVPGLWKWFLKWLALTPISQPLYIWLVTTHDVNFMLARVIVGSVMGLPGYTITCLVVFGPGFKWAARHVRVLAIRVWALGIEKA